MGEQPPKPKPSGNLQRLIADARAGKAEAPQSELNAAQPEPPRPSK